MKDRLKLKKELRERVYPDDKIAAILFFVFQPGVELDLDTKILHTKIYEFCQKEKYKKLMSDFSEDFENTRPFPTSLLLDRVVMRMRISKLIFWTLDVYFMVDKQRLSIENGTLPKFNKSEIRLLKQMASQLSRALEKQVAQII